MKGRQVVSAVALVCALVLVSGMGGLAQTPQPESALGTGFTYQGRLTDNGSPADGTYDFRFRLYDAFSVGNLLGTVALGNVTVSDGLFTVQLDYGSGIFAGEARWLEIGVRPGGSGGAYTTLDPRQELTAAPYALYAANAGNAWLLTGNAGTTPPSNFLGTTDDTSLVFKVNGARALRLEPNDTSPNLIGGYSQNSVTDSVYGATIGGGGTAGNLNRVTDNYGTVGGGEGNQAGDNVGAVFVPDATVGGGYGNTASSVEATVAGGGSNTASGPVATVGGGGGNTASGMNATVAGGDSNNAGGDYPGSSYATVGGGRYNQATGIAATVAGGYVNEAAVDYAAVGGGYGNIASGDYAAVAGGDTNTASGSYAAVGGGYNNAAAGAEAAIGGGGSNAANGIDTTVAGGNYNIAGGDYPGSSYAAVGGGRYNHASGTAATVAGGYSNEAAGDNASVAGGSTNEAGGGYTAVAGGYGNIANGDYAMVPGGVQNTALGYSSFAAGRRAKANYDGCFVWGDSTDADVACGTPNLWVARTSGGAYFYSNSALTAGVYLAPGGGSWSSVSDRALKDNVAAVDSQQLLARLALVPATTWNYKSQDPSIRHIGPMAQDFYAAFGLGEDDKHITTVDADGVALAAIQGLYTENQALKAENADQQVQIATLQQQNAGLDARLTALEQAARSGRSAQTDARLPVPWLLAGGLVIAGGTLAGWRRRPGGGR